MIVLHQRHQPKKNRTELFMLSAYSNLLIELIDKMENSKDGQKRVSKFMEDFKKNINVIKPQLEHILELSYAENLSNTTIQELSNKIETITRKTI